MLTAKQKKYLRGHAHAGRPLVRLGKAGITPAFLAEIETTLAVHELLKLKVAAGSRADRDEAITAIAARCGAELVSRIGNVALLYRARTEAPQIALPE
jgi:RNA-binding protein